mmetsp:Transcript_56952/g.146564  ORF Transcript_56952/g.146564 Transcript_56952/m.146564 type:complete len:504 (-) Transcript_56952:69-1580(-)
MVVGVMVHVVGAVAVMTKNGLALTLMRPVVEARRQGSLAGLDARLWPLNFTNQLLWTGYGIAVGDVWLFLSSLPAAIMWLFFCITVVELLSQEEGELNPVSPRTENHKQELVKSSISANFEDLHSLHDLSKMHRTQLIHKTELFVCGGLLFSGFVSFALTPDKFMGFPMLSGYLPEETRVHVFGYVCMLINIACYVEPIKKVKGVFMSRDASSIFLPNVLGALVNICVWLGYGIMTANAAIIVPLTIGLLNFSALLVLRLIFGSPAEVENCDIEAPKTGAQSGDVVGFQEAWCAIPSPVHEPLPPSFNHKRRGSTSSNASSASSVVSAASVRSFTKLVGGSAKSSTTGPHDDIIVVAGLARSKTLGHDNDIANLADLESPCASRFQSEAETACGTADGLPRQAKANELPDLSGRLREMGVYEDYLKWQRDYQNWRKGGTRGARGDLKVGSSMSSAIPDKTALQALPEADEMALQELPEEVERRASEKSDVESAGSMRNNVSRR